MYLLKKKIKIKAEEGGYYVYFHVDLLYFSNSIRLSYISLIPNIIIAFMSVSSLEIINLNLLSSFRF